MSHIRRRQVNNLEMHRLLRRYFITRTAESPGFIVMMILALFVLLLGSFAIVSRVGDSLLASSNQSRNRTARDVAESGSNEIVSELNKEQNRALLVANADLSANSSSPIPAGDADLANPIVNPCTIYSSSYNSSTNTWSNTVTSPSVPTLRARSLGEWQPLRSSGGTADYRQQYRLVSVSYSYPSRTSVYSSAPNRTVTSFPPDPIRYGIVNTSSTPPETVAKTLIKITIEGKLTSSSSPGGSTLSSVRIVREYEVVPKCCNRSFGFNTAGATRFGTDTRACISTALSQIVVINNGGSVLTSNNSINIVDENRNPVTRVLCNTSVTPTNPANSSVSQCTNGTLQIGSSVSLTPVNLTLSAPPFPGNGTRFSPLVTGTGSCTISNCITTPTTNATGGYSIQNDLYLRVNSTTRAAEVCQVLTKRNFPTILGSCTTIPTGNTSADSCSVISSRTYCKLSSISVRNGSNSGNIYVDTTNGPLSIYFDNPGSTTSAAFIDVGSNNSFIQVNCSGISGSTATSYYCANPASLSSADNLNLYAYGPGSFTFNGNQSGVAFNLFAPKSSFTITGGGSNSISFSGRLFVDTLDLRGLNNSSIQIPNSSPSSFLDCVGGDCVPGSTPFIDWIARSITFASEY